MSDPVASRKCSLRDTLVATRLDEVKRLLKTSDYPVGQIAKMCGFSSSVVLNHLFKKKFGISPGKWRKNGRGQAKAPGPLQNS